MTRSWMSLLLAVAITCGGAHGADRFWNNDGGGLFNDPANWDDGAGIAPLLTATTIFDLAATYTVQFGSGEITDRLLVRDGVVTFDIDAIIGYELLNQSPLTPAIEVGSNDGDTATLRLDGQELLGVYTSLGATSGSSGTVHLLDPLSQLSSTGQLWVGRQGAGVIDVTAGTVYVDGSGTVAHSAGSQGDVILRGDDARWSSAGTLVVGRSGDGTFVAEAGADVLSGGAIVGLSETSTGAAQIAGAATRWTILGSLDVGMRGAGSLIIEDGSLVTCEEFAAIGSFGPPKGGTVGGVGAVTVRDAGSMLQIDGGFSGGNCFVGLYGVGTLDVSGGGAVIAAGALVVTNNTPAGPVDVITIGLRTPTDYLMPAITVAEDVEMDATARLAVALIDGYEPAAGDAFELISAAGGVELVDLVLPAMTPPLVWGVTQTPGRLQIVVQTDDCVVDPDGESDCNGNGVDDACDIDTGASSDCNGNGIPDECDVADGTSVDCNANGIPDDCDIAHADSDDCNANGVPDECESTLIGDRVTASGDPGDAFGEPVAMDGDVLVVGRPSRAEVHVYRRGDAGFEPETVFTSPKKPVGDDDFGTAVSVSGNVIAVGASRADENHGLVYIYRFDGDTWQSSDIIQDNDGDESGRFGTSVAVDGTQLIVGAWYFNDLADLRYGAAYFFQDIGGSWLQRDRKVIADASSVRPRGARVDLAGDVGVVAMRSTSGSGRAAIYRRIGGLWTLEATLFPAAGSDTGTFGTFPGGVPVATDGTTVLVAGHRNDREAVFVYRSVDGSWVGDDVLFTFTDEVIGFGNAVDVNGDTALVGASDDPQAGEASGKAIVFERGASGWGQAGELRPPRPSAFDAAGAAVAINSADDTEVAVGSPGDDAEAMDAGAVYRFDLAKDCAAGCPEDLDMSGDVGFTDLLTVLADWGPCPPPTFDCPADLDGDGDVGFTDLLAVLAAWGPCGD